MLVLWLLLMAPLARWGLPTQDRDALLFGGAPAWDAARFDVAAVVAQLRSHSAGADTDRNPLADRDRLLDLTPDETARKEILVRYRLFSRQPDEMIILRALARMNPRRLDFDPHLYQYGGGYLYLVAASLVAGAATGLVHVTTDIGYYLDHPAAFAGSYLAARAVSLGFGLALLVAAYRLAALAGGRRAGWLALLIVAGSPVFISGVLEAKPHLPSACMLLWATYSALVYRARPTMRRAILLGLQAGYAVALVPTGIVGVLIAAALLVCGTRAAAPRALRRLGTAAGVAALVWALTNPYVLINLATNRAVLTSNLGNSTAMYEGQATRLIDGAVRVAELLPECVGVVTLLVAVLGLWRLLRHDARGTLVAASAGVGILAIAVLTGAGKPAEFGRFLILPATLLCIAAAIELAAWLRRRWAVRFVATALLLLAARGPVYVWHFAVDAAGVTESRLLAGEYLAARTMPNEPIGVLQEPAPYAVPPLDFTQRQIVLLPPQHPTGFTVDDAGQLPPWLVFTADDARTDAGAWWQPEYRLVRRFSGAGIWSAPLCWADKPVFIYERRGGGEN